MLTYILFILGFVFLIKGADILVEGSSSIAKRIGISDLVIGLTIVSLGTSAPELLVNIIASFKGSADIAIGNIIGSNISNILLILGVASIIYPLRVQKTTTWKEIPLNILSGFMLLVIANDIFLDKSSISILSRTDGIVLMVFFILFLNYTLSLARAHKESDDGYKKKPLYISIIMILVGIVGLAYGGQWVVDGAVVIAKKFGISEVLIGLTVVAVGTSLPELATSAVAAYKHKADIAIGNVVGSNLFNIFWVLGLSSLIRPMPINPAINTDIVVYMIAATLLFLFSFTRRKYSLGRTEGILFISAYIGYIIFLVIRG